jgi:hypothetical protein
MACSAALFGLRFKAHFFHRADAKQQPPGSNPYGIKKTG